VLCELRSADWRARLRACLLLAMVLDRPVLDRRFVVFVSNPDWARRVEVARDFQPRLGAA
jgi:hypothetical protein